MSWVAKWSSSQEFYDKPRSGRPSVLDSTAKKAIEKAKYKREYSTSVHERLKGNNVHKTGKPSLISDS